MSLIPNQFLFRISYPCKYVKSMPREDDDRLLDLQAESKLPNFAIMDEGRDFADVRIAWNEFGIGVQCEVRGKEEVPAGSGALADGLTVWIDTRDSRASHRASRFCHQFSLLATGGGSEGDEPVFTQVKIHRALQDAPMCATADVPFRGQINKSGYFLEAFLTASALNGFDPEQNTKLGFYYAVRDQELGEQFLSVGHAFPFQEDPSLWSILELKK